MNETNRSIASAAKALGRHVLTDGHRGVMTDRGLFNPLKSDTDTLDLICALGMEVYVDNHPEGCDCVEVRSVTHPQAGRSIINIQDQNVKQAVRQAVLLIAAAVGDAL